MVNYETTVALHASWGSLVKEEESGSYTIFLYKQHGTSRIRYTKLTARAGKLELGGKTCPILLAENNSDAIFTVAKRGDRTRRPVQVMIDLDGDGTFKGVQATTSDGRKMFAREQFTIDVLAHAKDLDHDGDAGHLAAVAGLLDYPLYLFLLKRAGFSGALILHGLTEAQVPASIAFVRNNLATIP